MKTSRVTRIAIAVLIAAVVISGVGLTSAKASEASCAEALLASITPLSSEHPRIQPSIQTKVIAPFLVRASTRIPLLSGHEKFHSRTYLTVFGWIRQRQKTDIYLL